ncbi:MAG: O-methyltransferase [Runella slithyformis]|nr:MAG: O-methyltransferase [Runella slithyformis]TAF01216.1 MAG: O-methyltransferase [Runella slithyformis]TAF25145.1 MAG: O-methyltransferase [Runella slithyformis]TAF49850.1 MAG: O-methyltransferase [Runella slithyformis]TAF81365.1 MAG: O-methyltransferase [Runella slithyformis]
MNFLPELIESYATAHTAAEPELLQKLRRETHAKLLHPQMLSGHWQGRLLAALSKMIRPQRVLEIGTYAGYSAICLAEGLATDGLLITIDVNEEMESFTRSFLAQSPRASQIDYRIGNAANLVPTLSETFDVVFIDADKLNYSLYYDLVFDKVRPGGVIIADNVLWYGKVTDTNKQPDKDTQALLNFNQKIHQDPRVLHLLLPVRDGLMIAIKN